AYVIPPPGQQHDPHAAQQLVSILIENGLQAKRAKTELVAADGRHFPPYSVVFLAEQPYRAFLIEMMERQRYPEVREGPDTKEIFRPSDVPAWTLPLMMGVQWERLDQPLRGELEDASEYDVSGAVNRLAKGTLVIHANDNAAYRMVNQLLAKGV